jgi:hypothetical protein
VEEAPAGAYIELVWPEYGRWVRRGDYYHLVADDLPMRQRAAKPRQTNGTVHLWPNSWCVVLSKQEVARLKQSNGGHW